MRARPLLDVPLPWLYGSGHNTAVTLLRRCYPWPGMLGISGPSPAVQHRGGCPGPERGSAMRVLVVEDHAKLALAIAAVLRREGMAADVAFDGNDALEKTAASRHDVLVLARHLT